MSNQSVKDVPVRRILVGALCILAVVGVMMVSYVFMRGLLAGLILAGGIIALFWMTRSMRRKR